MSNTPSTTDRYYVGRSADPSPAQIRAACLSIQQGWSASERRRRAGRSPDDALSSLIPVVQLSMLEQRIACGVDD